MKIVTYRGYIGKNEARSLRTRWGGELEIAEVPYLHKRRRNKRFWGDEWPPVPVTVTVEVGE